MKMLSLDRKFIILLLLALLSKGCTDHSAINIELSRYPDGKDFAFTITDDPDYGWLDEKYLIYSLLDKLRLKTTIAVWTLDNKHGTGDKGVNSGVGGITTTNDEYLRYTQALQKKGFEVCLHTAGPGNDLREETTKGYELFKDQFGHYPKININHTSNLENIYWGSDRFSNSILRFLYGLKSIKFYGNKEDSKYFWGDIAKENTKYVRGWTTDKINTISVSKTMPYHLKDKPYVNFWFECSDGYDYNKFMKLVSDDNIQKLVSERGTSIVYTHFGYGFIDKTSNILKKDFKKQLTKISKLNGWFVPASTILDRILLLRNIEIINDNSTVLIINHNFEPIFGLTIITDEKKLYLFNTNKWYYSNGEGEMVLGLLPSYTVFKLGKSEEMQKDSSPGIFERVIIVKDWFIGRFNK